MWHKEVGVCAVPASYLQYMAWDVTAIVKAWIEGGQPNYGFLVRDPNDGAVGTDAAAVFASKESGINNPLPLDPPILTVDYTPGVPVVAGGPVGGFVEPVNKLFVFAPYVALFGVVTAIAALIANRGRDLRTDLIFTSSLPPYQERTVTVMDALQLIVGSRSARTVVHSRLQIGCLAPEFPSVCC